MIIIIITSYTVYIPNYVRCTNLFVFISYQAHILDCYAKATLHPYQLNDRQMNSFFFLLSMPNDLDPTLFDIKLWNALQIGMCDCRLP